MFSGVKTFRQTTRVQKVGFKRKKPRDHEKNKSKKYSVISKRKIASTLTFLGGCFAATDI